MEKHVYELGEKRLVKRCGILASLEQTTAESPSWTPVCHFIIMLMDETRCERKMMNFHEKHGYYMWIWHVHTLGFCEWLVVAAFVIDWRTLLSPGGHWAKPEHCLGTLVGNKPGWQEMLGWMISFHSGCDETAPACLTMDREKGEELLCAGIHRALHWLLKYTVEKQCDLCWMFAQ